MTMDKGMLLPAITGRHKLYAMFHKGVWKLYDFMIKEDISIIDQPEGTLYSIMTSSKLHRIPDAADPENRLLAFGRDDTLTPTLYEDSTLVYKAAGNETIPSRFTIERFKDEGWTLGVLHLSDSAGNRKVRVSAVSRNFYPTSSFTDIKAQPGDDIIIDQIGGSPLTSDMLSSAGTIKDLQKDAYYQVDAYRGSDYIGLKTKADTP